MKFVCLISVRTAQSTQDIFQYEQQVTLPFWPPLWTRPTNQMFWCILIWESLKSVHLMFNEQPLYLLRECTQCNVWQLLWQIHWMELLRLVHRWFAVCPVLCRMVLDVKLLVSMACLEVAALQPSFQSRAKLFHGDHCNAVIWMTIGYLFNPLRPWASCITHCIKLFPRAADIFTYIG